LSNFPSIAGSVVLASGRSFLLAIVSLMAGVFLLGWAETLVRPQAYPWLFREQIIPFITFSLVYSVMLFWIRLVNFGDVAILYILASIFLLYVRISLFQKGRLLQIIALIALITLHLKIFYIERSGLSEYSLYFFLFVALGAFPWRRATRLRWKARVKDLAVKIPIAYVKICLVGGWWILAQLSPACAAILALTTILIHIGIFRISKLRPAIKQSFIAKNIPISMGVLACILVIALIQGESLSADRMPASRIFPDSTFDVAIHDDSTLVVLPRGGSSRPKHQEVVRAQFHQDGRWLSIPYTDHPERLIFDSAGRRTIIANFWSEPDSPSAAVFNGHTTIPLYLPNCISSIDLNIAKVRRELLILCETSHTLHFINLIDLTESAVLTLPSLMTYSLAVDESRNRVYVASQFSRKLFAIDLEERKIVGTKRTSSWNFNMVVDESTGNIWISNPASSSIIVLDPDLNFVDRIPVGYWPRDLVVDKARGLVMAGNYLSGAISFISLNTRQSLGLACVNRFPFFQQLRGLFLGPDGEMFLSKSDGVWKIEADEISSAGSRWGSPTLPLTYGPDSPGN
jgi:DNA-binding beta-propeller fold protein YncE